MNWVISGAGFEENSPLADCNEKFDQSGSYSETDSDIADEISKTIRQVSMRVAETQDEFIFQTLRDFGLSTSNIVVELSLIHIFLMENNNITEREVYEMYGLPERDCDGCSVYNLSLIHI